MPGNILSPVGPQAIYAQQGDVLIVNQTGLGQGLIVSWRMQLSSSGVIQEFSQNIGSGTNANGPFYDSIPLQEGWLLSVSVTGQTSGTFQRGACLLQVGFGSLTRQVPSVSVSGAVSPLAFVPNASAFLLISTTMSGNQTVCWPTSQTVLGTDGPGWNQTLTQSNPASATNFTFTFNGVQRYLITCIRFTLATSSNAGLRQAGILIADATPTIFLSCVPAVTQTISLTQNYLFMAGVGPNYLGASALPASSVGTDIISALPNNLYVSDAGTIKSSVLNIQTGDQISNISIRVQSWHESD